MKRIQRVDRLLAAIDGASLKARLVQNNCQRIGNHLFIVCDQNPGLRLIRYRFCHEWRSLILLS
jgi:hypothetical protein